MKLKSSSPFGFMPPGHIKDMVLEELKDHFQAQIRPLKDLVKKLKDDYSDLEESLKKAEKRLDSRDNESQRKIDIVREHNNDLKVEASRLDAYLKATDKVAAQAVKGTKENLRRINMNVVERDAKIQALRTQMFAYADSKTAPLYASVQTIKAKIESVSNQVSQYPVILEEFKNKASKRRAEVDAQMLDFNNSSKAQDSRISEAANKLNEISADFTNHTGDFKSHVSSVTKLKGDFDTYVNKHIQAHSKGDAEFANTKIQVASNAADFKNHTTDYSMHKKPKDVKVEAAKRSLTKGHFNRLFKRF